MDMIVFSLVLSLLLIHEMDAIRTKEWRMFIVLNKMPEETAYQVFAGLHVPLYIAMLLVMLWGSPSAMNILYYCIDSFLIGHGGIHLLFRNHKQNGFNTTFSKGIIYGTSFLAIVHLSWLVLS